MDTQIERKLRNVEQLANIISGDTNPDINKRVQNALDCAAQALKDIVAAVRALHEEE